MRTSEKLQEFFLQTLPYFLMHKLVIALIRLQFSQGILYVKFGKLSKDISANILKNVLEIMLPACCYRLVLAWKY